MLKPAAQPFCCGALVSCQMLMRRLALWLCAHSTTAADITEAGLQPPVIETHTEAAWLWTLLERVEDGTALLEHARRVASMHPQAKSNLAGWVQNVTRLPEQFDLHPPLQWPTGKPDIPKASWNSFAILMISFYEKGFKSSSGLPYSSNGTPTNTQGVRYSDYELAFREAHRKGGSSNSRDICVLCSGPLGDPPEVDHWLNKAAFPLLSVCADNLLLVCHTCNGKNKGRKNVHTGGSFADWFHPYLRPGYGRLRLAYQLPGFAVKCEASEHSEQSTVRNLDHLLNLSERSTREFKAEHAKQRDLLERRERRRLRSGAARHSVQEVEDYLFEWKEDLVDSEPYYQIHHLLAEALLDPDRISALHSELASITS